MTDEVPFAINEGTYQWCVRAFQALEKRLGLNIKVHHADGLLERGQIFLFNHFARFETIIPPYLVHRATGVHCRSVADHNLFDIGEGFSRFLRGVGAVPNNLPGLLPFLAAEILRGQKVVMFPEGGMVKDRRVVDVEGGYSVFSRTAKERRKHHRGAAVLALTLDIFKRRILDLHQKGDDERLGRWVEALGLADPSELMARALEPTLIVPATITFYPMRVRENVLSQALERFSGDLPRNFTEELLIEGNLLFRDTDMDIRLGEPLQPRKAWRWWERVLLQRHFQKIRSLDDLFGLRDQAEGMAEKLLARCLLTETRRIRDACMHGMYSGITVNLSHLASHLVTRLVARGERSIGHAAFHRTLYLALKNLQEVKDVHLHRSLVWPDRYRGLPDGNSPELERFLETCHDAGLVGRSRRSYRFLDPLCDDHAFDQVRLGNPLSVYANEVAPLRVVGETVEAALEAEPGVSDLEIASLLFDDELRAFEWNRRYFSKEHYRAVNERETATESGAPYLLLPQGAAAMGVLLVHGFLASPAELRAFGETLHARGYAVMGVRLAGHGTSPHDLAERGWGDWLNSVRRGYRILSAFAPNVVMVGFSTGGLLSLMLAAEAPPCLSGVAVAAPPLAFRNRMIAFAPLVSGLHRLTRWVPRLDEVLPFRENRSESPEINYNSIPVAALNQLRALVDAAELRLPEIQVPVTVLQGDEDPVVDPKGARRLFDALPGPDKAFHSIPSRRHGLIRDDIGETRSLLEAFVSWAGTGAPRQRETG